ncbi:MAG TPA: NADH-quinone oxidoreductase subunit A [Dehalococcoidales bacterium]|nr:NADH-quinone oxidoreductase subunit A [Dehalococcoidales bacterium]
MLTEFGFIGLFLIAATLLAGLMIFIPFFLRLIKLVPHNPGSVKNSPFECGMPTIGKTWVRFNFHYYFYALLFLTMDVFVILLFLWAANLRQLGGTAFIIMLIIIFILAVAYLYAWKKGTLEWK